MGQANHNLISIAAKKGEIPPKPRKMGKREFERLMLARMRARLAEKTGISEDILKGPYEN